MTLNILFKYFSFLPVLALCLFFSYSKYSPIKGKLFHLNNDFDHTTSKKFFWIVTGAYLCIFGSMSCLRYISLHSTIADLGFYENRIWQIAHNYRFEHLINGHFSPILFIHAIIYRFIPSTLTLLILQTVTITLASVPLYYLAIRHLKNNKLALLVVAIFFLFTAVEYNNLFDFHPDHVFIVLILSCFYFLETGKKGWFVVAAVLSSLVKEPFLFAVAGLGIYTIVRYRWYKTGLCISIFSMALFFIHAKIVLPHYYGGINPVIQLQEGSYSYLGSSFSSILKTLFWHPLSVIKELINLKKFLFIYVLFVPLLLIPLLSPATLVLTLPSFAIQLLSTCPLHYAINNQYSASMIPFIFVSFIYGLKRFVYTKNGNSNPAQYQIENIPTSISYKEGNQKDFHFATPSSPPYEEGERVEVIKSKNILNNIGPINSQPQNMLRIKRLEAVAVSVLFVSFYFNIMTGASPLSYSFWNCKNPMNPYSFKNYMPSGRDRILSNTIHSIPEGTSVCVQNSVYMSHLAKRNILCIFPYEYEKCDYIVVDEKRLKYVGDHIDNEKYDTLLKEIHNTHTAVSQDDGIYLFGKRVLFPLTPDSREF